MGTPTITYNSATAAASASDLAVAFPASIAANDLLIAIAATDDIAGATQWSAPSGFTHRGTFGDAVSDSVVDVWTKVAAGTETGNLTIPQSGSNSRDRAAFCIRATDGGSLVEWGLIGTAATALGTSVVAPTITTLAGNSLVLAVGGFDGDDYGALSYNNGFSAEGNAGVGGGAGIGLHFASKAVLAAGAVGATTLTTTASDGQVGFLLAFNGTSVAAPAVTVDPVISSDSPSFGYLITSDGGTVTGSPAPTLTYSWYRDGVVIAGETGLTYLTVEDDVDTAITFKVAAVNSEGSATSNASNAINVVFPTAGEGSSFSIWQRLESPLGTLEATDYSGRTHDNWGGFVAPVATALDGSSILCRRVGGLRQDFDFIAEINGTGTTLESELIGFESNSETTGHALAIAVNDEVELNFTCANNFNLGVGLVASFADPLVPTSRPSLISVFFNGVTGTNREGIYSGNSHNYNASPTSPVAFTITSAAYYCENGNLANPHNLSVEVAGAATSIGSVSAGVQSAVITGLSIDVEAGDLVEFYANDGGVGAGEDCRLMLGVEMRGDKYKANRFPFVYNDTDTITAEVHAAFTSPVDMTLEACSFSCVAANSSTIDVIINGGTAQQILSYSIGSPNNMQLNTGLSIAITAGDTVEIRHNGTGTTGLGGVVATWFRVEGETIPEPTLPDDVWPSDPDDPESLPSGNLNGASGGPQGNKIAFEPEFGPSIDRRKGSFVARHISIELPPLTPGQYALWRTFYYTNLKNGSLPMTFPDPITKTNQRFQFKQGKPGVREAALPDGRIKVTFDLIRIE